MEGLGMTEMMISSGVGDEELAEKVGSEEEAEGNNANAASRVGKSNLEKGSATFVKATPWFFPAGLSRRDLGPARVFPTRRVLF